ncbi:intercellular adhesion molecule 5-like [Heteronotia binoei]|uniref:intercellular adhesion molecule 5-like n=1 Tax=Heteronotia binoei TaxID=13085 RepID=UPI002930CBBF|nr:intercellular adhesion molecule 5-like [Heteronotia binoei]
MHPLLVFLLASAAMAQETQEQPFVSAWPENPVVEFGKSLTLNCSTNCQSVTSGGLETSLEKEDTGEGPTWKAFRLVNVNNWDSAPSCYFDCSDAPDMKPHRVNLTVYRAPTLVKLDPVPEMEVGKNYTLTCRVSNVAPMRNVSVTFLKGEEELHTQTFEKHAAREAGDVAANHTITAGRQDNGEEISCRAALDLRPEGPLFETTSHNQSLKAVVFLRDPRLIPLRSMEANTSKTVSCEVSGVFPAKEAKFELTFAEERLTPSVTTWGDTARAKAQVSPSVAGNHSLKCTVSLGPVTRTVEDQVYVYSLPGLVLTVSPREILANNRVDVVCEDSHPEDTQPRIFSARIRNSKGVLESGNVFPLRATVTAVEEDDGQEFTCQVEVDIDGTPVIKKTSANLIVYYGPQMNDSSCPSTLTWKAGGEETFTCSAWGNPSPDVTCRKDGVLYPLGVPQLITEGHQGSYNCSASNAHGSVATFVTVRVEVEEPPTLIICLAILAAVVFASIASVGYYMYHKSYKMRKYRVSQRKAQGNSSEKKCLNGNVQTDSVSPGNRKAGNRKETRLQAAVQQEKRQQEAGFGRGTTEGSRS